MNKGRFQSKKRTIFMAAGVAVFFLVAYLVIVPTVVARHYEGQVDAKTVRAKAELKAISTGSNVVVFEDPDIALNKREALLAKTLGGVQKAQATLADLQNANTLPLLPGNGFMGDYHKATIREERTNSAVRQSREVLDGYADTLAYIKIYTGIQLYLDNRLTYINGISDFGALSGQGSTMTGIANHIHADREHLAAITPPPDFAPLHSQAQQTLAEAANAFENLADGLNHSADAQVYSAVTTLEQVALKNDVDDKQMMTTLAESSPTLLQLTELPEKIEHVEQK